MLASRYTFFLQLLHVVFSPHYPHAAVPATTVVFSSSRRQLTAIVSTCSLATYLVLPTHLLQVILFQFSQSAPFEHFLIPFLRNSKTFGHSRHPPRPLIWSTHTLRDNGTFFFLIELQPLLIELRRKDTMAPIERVTMFKIPKREDREKVLEGYRVMKKTAVKVCVVVFHSFSTFSMPSQILETKT